jgi:Predicted integral membrane protein (DUF2269)
MAIVGWVLTGEAGPPGSAAYDLVLLAHVLSALVGFGAVVVAGIYALAFERSSPPTEAVRRYYRPGVNWAGRVIYLVPAFGGALIAMSHGVWSYADHWVVIGLGLWGVAAVVAEVALWPAERRLQAVVADPTSAGDLRPQCLRVALVAGFLLIVLVVASVVMVAKP